MKKKFSYRVRMNDGTIEMGLGSSFSEAFKYITKDKPHHFKKVRQDQIEIIDVTEINEQLSRVNKENEELKELMRHPLVIRELIKQYKDIIKRGEKEDGEKEKSKSKQKVSGDSAGNKAS